MKTRLTAVVLAVLCCLAWAAGEKADGQQPTAISLGPSLTPPDADAISIPRLLSYQGKLTDTLGIAVPDTVYSVRFRLYSQPSGGTQFWEETQSVRTKAGLFSVLLGSVIPIGSMPDAGEVYLGVAVAGGAELTPRLRIAGAAYAYLSERAANSDLLQGRDTTTFSRSTHNHDAAYVNEGQADAVTGAMITDATIAAVDLGQMGAASGQVMKWTGSVWAPRNDSVGGSGGGGTVTSVSQATGLVCTPNPITATGTVGFDQTWGDGRYVNVAGDSMTGALAAQGELRVYGKGRIGLGNSNSGAGAFVAGEGNNASATYASVPGGADNTASGIYSHISGGGENRAAGDYSSVGGGIANYAAGGRSAVAGGSDNEAHGLYGTIGGGLANTAGDATDDTGATVAGGYSGLASADYAVIGGGQTNQATGRHSAVLGGTRNVASADGAVVGGGSGNTASGAGSGVFSGSTDSASGGSCFVGGGSFNRATGTFSAVLGGAGNVASGTGSAVTGGASNVASGEYAVCGGSYGDTALGLHSGVFSGYRNRAGDAATDTAAVVAGGYGNLATERFACVGGGKNDTASGIAATVGGGESNRAGAAYSAVAGGRDNTASGNYATVGGGRDNTASGSEATVGGGYSNEASGLLAAVGGGYRNEASGYYSVVGGGHDNTASALRATVAGGASNDATSTSATVSGGESNNATAGYATVGGGKSNNADGSYATIPGGGDNAASGWCSFAAGELARANHSGCFVWGDSVYDIGSLDSIYTTGVNQWRVRARGGAWFYSNLAMTTGAYLAPGTNAWTSACDSATKEDFREVDRQELLGKVAALRVRDYKMKDQGDGTRHIGPVAQDFHNAFGYGETETGINTADADGVMLAAIQALCEQNRQLTRRVAELEAKRADK